MILVYSSKVTDKKETKKDKSEDGFAKLADSNLDTVILHTFESVFQALFYNFFP